MMTPIVIGLSGSKYIYCSKESIGKYYFGNFSIAKDIRFEIN
jgi:hypothetical protein